MHIHAGMIFFGDTLIESSLIQIKTVIAATANGHLHLASSNTASLIFFKNLKNATI